MNGKYRIITDGIRFKVQIRCFLLWWDDITWTLETKEEAEQVIYMLKKKDKLVWRPT